MLGDSYTTPMELNYLIRNKIAVAIINNKIVHEISSHAFFYILTL